MIRNQIFEYLSLFCLSLTSNYIKQKSLDINKCNKMSVESNSGLVLFMLFSVAQ